MKLGKSAAKALLGAVLLAGNAAPAALAQAAAGATTPQHVLTETFDGPDPSLMLGGQIGLQGDNSPWLVYVADGKLIMENRQDPKSLHHDDVEWVRFPDSAALETTENMTISALVGGENIGTGGVGILVGSGQAGAYLMFSVDAQGHFYVLEKDGRKLSTVHTASHPAIVANGPNLLTFEIRGSQVAFLANGTEVIRFPDPNRLPGTRPHAGRAGVGLSAFGTGRYYFETVEISRPD